ncbi:major pilin protein fimA [Antarctobacter heliothermus]|uniref:Major pilin protein fimA n=1 Tax=Antarctobacter heliothermus TaxID=74033 RepID=A0A222E545_9RHOB|nr:DUF1028 domain-containing protein [Antarctobacter heliothermus]ASP21108.1 major pilin protein fimA [Antarctobacter heliothermus]
MTISIMAYDEKSGLYGGAATTGSLCVGGWVLHGDAESGMSASQGSLPSTMWGTDTLALMKAGTSAQDAADQVTKVDSGRGHRQLATLDPKGGVGHFTGADSIATAGARQGDGVIVTGNLLSSEAVLDAALAGYQDAQGSLDLRLMAALDAAFAAGGDSRGLLSAALLIVGRDMAPLTLRIDYSPTPLDDLRALHDRATTGDYADWAVLVPTLNEPERAAPYGAKTDQPV